MVKRLCCAVVIGAMLFLSSGCVAIGAALSAGMAYGIYQATRGN